MRIETIRGLARASTLIAVGLLLTCIGSTARASVVYLSDYMGISPPGTLGLTSTSFSPYMTVVQAPQYDFGVNRIGNFGTGLVQFNDAGPFTRAIGAVPGFLAPQTTIEFNLQAFRNDGLSFDTFFARVGIDPVAGGDRGATFSVQFFDAGNSFLEATSQSIGGVRTPSVEMAVSIPVAATTMRLVTFGLQGQLNGNHAAWGDARLAPVPLPASLWLFGSAILGGLGFVRRRVNI
jgi:hypothetical protein